MTLSGACVSYTVAVNHDTSIRNFDKLKMAKVQRPRAQTIFQRLIIALLVVLSFGALASDVILDMKYSETRPNSPRPEEARVYAQHVRHGTLVYLTRTEKLTYQFLPAVCLVFGGGAFFLYHRWLGKSS